VVATKLAFLNHHSESREKINNFSQMPCAKQPLIQLMRYHWAIKVSARLSKSDSPSQLTKAGQLS